jgi:NAD(P)H-dependent FMN reductase
MKIQVILGSVREGRLGERVAKWVMSEAAKAPGLEVELVDLKDYPVPAYAYPFVPGARKEPYPDPVARAWSEKLAAADGYVIVTPEYNHSIPGALSNAFDYLWSEIREKQAAVVSYSTGPVGGARSAEEWVLLLNYMQMEVAGVVSVGRADKAIDEAGGLLEPGLDQALAGALARLVELGAELKK